MTACARAAPGVGSRPGRARAVTTEARAVQPDQDQAPRRVEAQQVRNRPGSDRRAANAQGRWDRTGIGHDGESQRRGRPAAVRYGGSVDRRAVCGQPARRACRPAGVLAQRAGAPGRAAADEVAATRSLRSASRRRPARVRRRPRPSRRPAATTRKNAAARSSATAKSPWYTPARTASATCGSGRHRRSRHPGDDGSAGARARRPATAGATSSPSAWHHCRSRYSAHSAPGRLTGSAVAPQRGQGVEADPIGQRRRNARPVRPASRPACDDTAAVAAAISARELGDCAAGRVDDRGQVGVRRGRCGRAAVSAIMRLDRCSPVPRYGRQRVTGRPRHGARPTVPWTATSARSMAPGPTFAATSGLPPRGDLAGRRHHFPARTRMG